MEDLYTEKMYLVDMKAMFCYESRMPQCSVEDMFTILENSKMPKRFCDRSDHVISHGM